MFKRRCERCSDSKISNRKTAARSCFDGLNAFAESAFQHSFEVIQIIWCLQIVWIARATEFIGERERSDLQENSLSRRTFQNHQKIMCHTPCSSQSDAQSIISSCSGVMLIATGESLSSGVSSCSQSTHSNWQPHWCVQNASEGVMWQTQRKFKHLNFKCVRIYSGKIRPARFGKLTKSIDSTPPIDFQSYRHS